MTIQPTHMVERPRLNEMLDRAVEVPLTLGSAAEDTLWITWATPEVDAKQFWADVWESLRGHDLLRADKGFTRSWQDSSPLVGEIALALSALSRPLTLVLDGYERVSSAVVDDLDFLLCHCDRLQVVVLTRVDLVPSRAARPREWPLQLVPPRTRVRAQRSDIPPPDVVIERLTTKELEVLAHLSELLSTEETAAAMFVSVNTIRTHVRSILRKLAVSRRNEAVRRGRALGLITA